MKKQKYDIQKIYQKLINDEIPLSYVDFVVSRCVTTCAAQVEKEREYAMTTSTAYSKLYGKM